MRVVILLSILFVVLLSTWMNERRLASWERPIWVTVYPMVADNSPATRSHAESIQESTFAGINRFFERELSLYDVSLTPPFNFQIAPVSDELPPAIPDRHDMFAIAVPIIRTSAGSRTHAARVQLHAQAIGWGGTSRTLRRQYNPARCGLPRWIVDCPRIIILASFLITLVVCPVLNSLFGQLNVHGGYSS